MFSSCRVHYSRRKTLLKQVVEGGGGMMVGVQGGEIDCRFEGGKSRWNLFEKRLFETVTGKRGRGRDWG